MPNLLANPANQEPLGPFLDAAGRYGLACLSFFLTRPCSAVSTLASIPTLQFPTGFAPRAPVPNSPRSPSKRHCEGRPGSIQIPCERSKTRHTISDCPSPSCNKNFKPDQPTYKYNPVNPLQPKLSQRRPRSPCSIFPFNCLVLEPWSHPGPDLFHQFVLSAPVSPALIV